MKGEKVDVKFGPWLLLRERLVGNCAVKGPPKLYPEPDTGGEDMNLGGGGEVAKCGYVGEVSSCCSLRALLREFMSTDSTLPFGARWRAVPYMSCRPLYAWLSLNGDTNPPA